MELQNIFSISVFYTISISCSNYEKIQMRYCVFDTVYTRCSVYTKTQVYFIIKVLSTYLIENSYWTQLRLTHFRKCPSEALPRWNLNKYLLKPVQRAYVRNSDDNFINKRYQKLAPTCIVSLATKFVAIGQAVERNQAKLPQRVTNLSLQHYLSPIHVKIPIQNLNLEVVQKCAP